MRLAQHEAGLRFTLDEWMEALYWRGNPPPTHWPDSLRSACLEHTLNVAMEVLLIGRPVILDIGTFNRELRRAVVTRLHDSRAALSLHVLDVPYNLRRDRVLQRNEHKGETYSFFVSPELFDIADAMWDLPGREEMRELERNNVRIVIVSY